VNRDDLRAAYYCCSEVLRTRRRVGAPIPDWMTAYFRRLDAAYRGMAPRGPSVVENGDEGTQSKDDVIGSVEVAKMLSLAPRQVRRRATQLGGTLVAGRWLFMRETVAEYAERRHQNG
jgi:hypothetical protein